MLVALAILGLVFGLTLSVQGPWLKRTRDIERAAEFWSALGPARAAVEELTLSAIDIDTASASSTGARFVVANRRLSPTPIAIDISVRGDQLRVQSADRPDLQAILLQGGPELRLRNEYLSSSENHRERLARLVVEARQGDLWTPLFAAPLGANANLECNFDLISRRCR